ESNSDELCIIKRGSKPQGLFFLIIGLLFEFLVFWAFWSFLDTTNPLAFFWLGLIYSEFFPFTSLLLFLFGGGCFLIAIREIGWIESWIIKKKLFHGTPGIQKRWQLFEWTGRSLLIPKNQIKTLRVHKIPLDALKLLNRYQLEIDYQISIDSPLLEKNVIYSDESKLAGATTLRLAEKIREILKMTEEIERTEAAPRAIQVSSFTNHKKKREKR
ncbi:MAG: hypothetical protein ACFFDT_04255, partial [Candidatus Hodarchaeota archaeon]